ncbi:5827_t:CDS:2, partial [Dentiscutata erythropus]
IGCIEISSEEETTRARAIDMRGSVFVLDELTTNLDEGNFENLMAGIEGSQTFS